MTDRDRDDRGTVAANFVRDFYMHRHRGVIDCDDKYVVFGNDGYFKDSRSQEQVSYVRERLKALDLREAAFGVDDEDGYSWALVIDNYQRLEVTEELNEAVWESWNRASRREGGAV
jgi:hypothetical protein